MSISCSRRCLPNSCSYNSNLSSISVCTTVSSIRLGFTLQLFVQQYFPRDQVYCTAIVPSGQLSTSNIILFQRPQRRCVLSVVMLVSGRQCYCQSHNNNASNFIRVTVACQNQLLAIFFLHCFMDMLCCLRCFMYMLYCLRCVPHMSLTLCSIHVLLFIQCSAYVLFFFCVLHISCINCGKWNPLKIRQLVWVCSLCLISTNHQTESATVLIKPT